MEDTIYYLSESLRKEGLDLEVFLKVMITTLLLIIIRRTIYVHVALFQRFITTSLAFCCLCCLLQSS